MPSTPSSTPGPRPAAPARRTSRTWSRCTRSTAPRGWRSSRCRSTTRPTPRPSPTAEKFLQEKKAVFTNVLLDEDYGDGFDKLDINAIPAVFLFGPDGKEVKRFTMDDPNNQFTYEEVEKEVVALLEGSAGPAARNDLGDPALGLIASTLSDNRTCGRR